jgi:membrane protein
MNIPGLNGIDPMHLGKKSFQQFSKHDMTTYAAALAYNALFALFPFLIFLIALLGFLNIPGFFDWILEQAENAVPADAYERLTQVIDQIQGQSRGGLLSFGIIAAIWSASSGVRSVMNAMNVVYEVEESRPAAKRYAVSVVYTICVAILMVASAALMLTGPQVMEAIADTVGLGDLFVTLWTWLRWPVLAILLMISAALIYYATPNIDQKFTLITPGAVVAVVVWVIASVGFSIYASNFTDYSATYGSIGGMIALLFFFYIASAVLMFGGEVNAEIRRQQLAKPDTGAMRHDDTSAE